ncbi:succinate dehydrogenase, hydrophobic membrane anchor protein [Arsenophonus sp.]|uniref:succinate dehydrogenase, hydrophobic membrane anchor protein n=1 Tax=Arsenophonus sp. TaxID=1872640 RepID=UPI00387A163D
MVVNVSTLGRTGTQDWLLLRASAIIIALYTFYIVSFIVTTDLNYTVWRTFFAFPITKIFTILTLISILVHAWIGLWQVLTDYVKSIALRLSLQLFFIVILMTYLIYGTIVVWGA